MTHDEQVDIVRAITRLETKVDQLLALERRVRYLEDKENQRKGGWVTLSALLTVSSAVGGLFVAFITSHK